MNGSTTATAHHRDPSMQAPEYIRKIAPYLPGKPISELAREFGLAERDIVKLASNENPRGPGPAVRAAIAAAVEDLSRYPDGNGFELKAALAARHRVAPEQIVLGNGSNDVLELVAQAFLRPGDHAIVETPCYESALQLARSTGADVSEWRRRYEDGWAHDLDALAGLIRPATRMLYLNQPHNPTGTLMSRP